MAPTRRIGIFGGTFDPPHNGHLVVAANVRMALDLDVVLMVVANVPWQKVGGRLISSAEDRLAMVEALVDGVPGVEASDLEVRRGGDSYTADTLRSLAGPGTECFLVLGRDAAANLPTWERVDEVQRAAVVVLVERPGVASAPLPEGWRWLRVDIPRLDISSSDVRQRVADGLPLDGLVPPSVIACLRRRGLYG